MSNLIYMRPYFPWQMYDFIFNLTPTGRQVSKDVKIMDDWIDKAIERRKINFDKFNSNSNLNNNTNDYRVFDHLINLSKTNPTLFNENQIKDEVNTLIFATSDPFGSTLTFALYLLGHHTSIQSIVHEEIDHVFGDDKFLDFEKVNQLKYVEWMLKETLRLYPALTFVGRDLDYDTKIGDHIIPKGTSTVSLINHIHRDPQIYSNPTEFRPERWETHPSNSTFLSFSAAPRNCMGPKIAMMEMKTLIAYICKDYSIKSLTEQNELRIGLELNVRPLNPVGIQFTKRNI